MSRKFSPFFIEWGEHERTFGYSVKLRDGLVKRTLAWFPTRAEAKEYMEDCWHDHRQREEYENGDSTMA